MDTKNILITGGTGLIGRRLTELLQQKGHHVSHLGRHQNSDVPGFVWDIDKSIIDKDAFVGADTIVHLAGSGIADKPWTEKRKQEIVDSRVKSTQLLYSELAKRQHVVKNFISASAVGYYGFGNEHQLFTENSPPGQDFLATVTKQWEEEAKKLEVLGIRVATVRTGVVLSERGGALKPMVLPVKFFVGSALGTGKQWISWIHLDDLCRIFIHLIENENLEGVFNGVAGADTNKEFTKAIASILQKPLWLPNVPAFALKFILGEMADLVLEGSNVTSEKIKQTGFQFQHTTLEATLKSLLVQA